MTTISNGASDRAPVRISEQELLDALALLHSAMDPAELTECFKRELAAEDALERDVLLRTRDTSIDKGQWLVLPVLEQVEQVLVDAEVELLRTEVNELVEDVLDRMTAAGVLAEFDPLEPDFTAVGSARELQASTRAHELLVDFIEHTKWTVTDLVLDIVADTVTGELDEDQVV
jgi:hypothetical protein